jgi:hypothetical protein
MPEIMKAHDGQTGALEGGFELVLYSSRLNRPAVAPGEDQAAVFLFRAGRQAYFKLARLMPSKYP